MPRDEHRRHVDGAAREGLHLGDALGIGAAPHAIALKRAGELGAAVFGRVDVDLGLGQPLAGAISAADGMNGATVSAMPLSVSIT